MRRKPKTLWCGFLFLQNPAPVTVSADQSENEAHLVNMASCSRTIASFLHFLPILPPTFLLPFFLPCFPSCTEVIADGIVAELHCVMTAQSRDFMIQSMSNISQEQRRAFSKCSKYHRRSYVRDICHRMISRALLKIQAPWEGKRAHRY